MCRGLFFTCLLAGLLALATAVPAEARRDGTRHERSSLDEAVSNVRRDTGGRVLSAEKRERNRGTTYRIKVLMPNASVRSFDVETQVRERH
ncbi:MAG: hypothetical protein NUV51_13120 [Sulfuricaulis sp.]|nr:hypothetical protein [Sulfuricaulis sp.]